MTIATGASISSQPWDDVSRALPIGAFQDVKAVVHPGMNYFAGATIEAEAGVTDLINAEKRWLYVCGTVTYEDIFGKDRTTEFFFRVFGFEAMAGKPGMFNARCTYMPKHNEAT
jgi:hypothetical protein